MINVSPYTRRRIENAAYNRAAGLAKSYAEHWEREAQARKHDGRISKFPDALKAGHWRIIEKEIRKLAADETDEQKRVTGAVVHEFIERGRRAQAAVDGILDEYAKPPAQRRHAKRERQS
jgi:hypothetical protein